MIFVYLLLLMAVEKALCSVLNFANSFVDPFTLLDNGPTNLDARNIIVLTLGNKRVAAAFVFLLLGSQNKLRTRLIFDFYGTLLLFNCKHLQF